MEAIIGSLEEEMGTQRRRQEYHNPSAEEMNKIRQRRTIAAHGPKDLDGASASFPASAPALPRPRASASSSSLLAPPTTSTASCTPLPPPAGVWDAVSLSSPDSEAASSCEECRRTAQGARRPSEDSEGDDAPPVKRQHTSLLQCGWVGRLAGMPLPDVTTWQQQRLEEARARGRQRYACGWERDMEAAGLDPEEHRAEWHHVRPEDIVPLQEAGAFVALRERVHELEK